jgi:hypothetical protein
MALKQNHEILYKDVEDYFEFQLKEEFKDTEYQFVRTADKGHERIEVREYYLITDISWLENRKEWEGLKEIKFHDFAVPVLTTYIYIYTINYVINRRFYYSFFIS